ncbi:hypothetical protein C9994_06405 [Marivirga lumbricoides]|uniref:Uncharacterized protein n=1 Tax=Marivirga lumbricoides TaxID=1046115 RepID=A0A2T4DS59_9BACT|nr:hypothetical protein C9994_06405 [Marivirga lumbricoides]
MSTCIIIPYFGSFPLYFNLFIHSLKSNPNLNVKLFTDFDVDDYLKINVPNLEVVKFTLDDFNFLASNKLDLNIALTNPYKLCEFKPAYGHIFEDYIVDFKFWGFGDLDLIYGNTKNYLTSDLLGNYDIISFRKEYVSGSLCILRNIEKINKLYKQSKSYKLVFTDLSKFYSFAECNHKWRELKIKGNSVFNVSSEIEHFTFIIKDAERKDQLKSLFHSPIKESIPKNDFIIYSNSQIIDNRNNEYLLYHYVTEKRKPYFTYWKDSFVPEKLFIDDTGFYDENDFYTKRTIKRIKRKLFSLPNHMFHLLKRVKSRIGKI